MWIICGEENLREPIPGLSEDTFSQAILPLRYLAARDESTLAFNLAGEADKLLRTRTSVELEFMAIQAMVVWAEVYVLLRHETDDTRRIQAWSEFLSDLAKAKKEEKGIEDLFPPEVVAKVRGLQAKLS